MWVISRPVGRKLSGSVTKSENIYIYYFFSSGTLVTGFFFCHSVLLGTSSSGFIYIYKSEKR